MSGRAGRAAVMAMAVALAFLAACGGGDSGSADSKQGWEDKNGELVEAYSRDLSVAVNTINQGERTATLSTCNQVIDDAKEVRAKALPVPEPTVDGPLTKAVDVGIKAAEACLTGARNTDARSVEAAQRDFAEARQAMDEAEAAIKAWT